MANVDMQTLPKTMQVIGEDSLVQLKMSEPGLIIGLWKVKKAVMVFSNYSLLLLSTASKNI